jgi:hypothetical protein
MADTKDEGIAFLRPKDPPPQIVLPDLLVDSLKILRYKGFLDLAIVEAEFCPYTIV